MVLTVEKHFNYQIVSFLVHICLSVYSFKPTMSRVESENVLTTSLFIIANNNSDVTLLDTLVVEQRIVVAQNFQVIPRSN